MIWVERYLYNERRDRLKTNKQKNNSIRSSEGNNNNDNNHNDNKISSLAFVNSSYEGESVCEYQGKASEGKTKPRPNPRLRTPG